MDLTIFRLKPIFSKGGENILDMTYPSIRYNYSSRLDSVVAISRDMSMRPDLVSRAAYGTNNQWDLILKFNGYSNPFSVNEGDIYLIPSLDDMTEQLAPSGVQNVVADTVRKQYIDVSKKAKNDPRLAENEMKRREAQRKLVENLGVQSVSNLPPNISEEGDREIVIRGGKVFFGPDISRGKLECETPLTKSEFISKLIKNRLKNGQ